MWIALYLALSGLAVAPRELVAQAGTADRLPSALISYTYLSSRYVSFRTFLDGASDFEWRTWAKQLEASLRTLDCDVPERFAFLPFAFTIQADMAGQEAGFRRGAGKTLEDSGVPFDGILFVTYPVQATGGKVVVIMSSVSPERTTVFTMDEQLRVNLVYDSYKAGPGNGVISIGSVYRVRAQGAGLFTLDERMIPGGRGRVPPNDNRRFQLDVVRGSLTLAK